MMTGADFRTNIDKRSFTREQMQDFRTYVNLFAKYWEMLDAEDRRKFQKELARRFPGKRKPNN
jgi:hypothetical protein